MAVSESTEVSIATRSISVSWKPFFFQSARCAVVFPTAAIGFFDDIIPIDLVAESVEAGGRFSLSFRV
jgi:hypothetical protein